MSQPQSPIPLNQNNPTPPNRGDRHVGRGLFGWMLFVGLVIMLLIVLRSVHQPAYQVIPYTEFETLLSNNKVKSFVIDGDEVSGQVKEGVLIPGSVSRTSWYVTDYPRGTFSGNSDFLLKLEKTRGDATGEARNSSNLAVSILPWLLVALMFGAILWQRRRKNFR